MAIFRKHTPKRKDIKTSVSNHREHLENLKEDFQNRCGYCNDIKLGNAEFEIDHFVPQKPKKFETTINSTSYFNLVYACKSCNRAKRNEWPTNDENIHNLNNEGFIDPCDDEYNNQFERKYIGCISHITPLGEWMYFALKLYKPQHEILWNIDQLNTMILEIKQLQKELPTHFEINTRLNKVYDNFHEYLQKLSNI